MDRFMRHWQSPKKPRARIEIIPMIDVMMFLLVFFVLISINVIPALGVKTVLPTSEQAQDIKSIVNALVTLGKNEELQLNGKPVALAQLAPAIRSLKKPDSRIAVVINSDKGVEVQRLIDVMDTLRANGYASFSIASKKKS